MSLGTGPHAFVAELTTNPQQDTVGYLWRFRISRTPWDIHCCPPLNQGPWELGYWGWQRHFPYCQTSVGQSADLYCDRIYRPFTSQKPSSEAFKEGMSLLEGIPGSRWHQTACRLHCLWLRVADRHPSMPAQQENNTKGLLS